ncbi:hypothetical protein K503DRAFT_864378 [Rhizopogon vinicolor AM-OR11-026]|uniref:Uncharacterized protein n=1 Tax=Rhizopogon vinicolor AM-OR11-026 TaxID=1314800 RepID=A0A1B7N7E5_9AGAM|nr:hypothetical protein K503DRAFT_864378 [Rhizopogon vinicolor AM-OR11-026]
MPGRRVPSTRPSSQPSKGEDDIDFMPSQGSSDDHSNETFAAVAAEFKGALYMIAIGGADYMRLLATWEKKMRGRDDKIIQATQKELDLALQNNETEINRIINDIETIYQEYLEKNAILEDRKRKIMAAIAEKQEELIPLAVKRHQAIISLGHEVENGQLEGMALIKGTCQPNILPSRSLDLQDVAQELGTLSLDC